MASFDFHRWTSYQLQNAKKLILDDTFPNKIKLLSGTSVVSDEKGEKAYCSTVVIDREDMKVIEKASFTTSFETPYIPSFRAVREAPVIEQCFNKLTNKPDVLFCHGHGLAHPRFFGLASHLGLLLNIPTIGVANQLLVGEELTKSPHVISLYHEGRLIGYRHVDYSHPNRKLFISPGHLISHETAYALSIQTCNGNHSLPLAIILAREEARLLRNQ